MDQKWHVLQIVIVFGSLNVLITCRKLVKYTRKEDILAPYLGHHGPKFHRHRHIRSLQPVQFNNVTHEIYPSDNSRRHPIVDTETFVKSLGYRGFAYGHVFTVRNPQETLSVLEPLGPGGCKNKTRSTVKETALLNNCILATNAGFFDTKQGLCLGDIVSNGRLVQQTNVQNAHFGIRKDGSLYFGYIPEDVKIEEEFEQLVSGVIWLVRDGRNFVSASQAMESSSIQETGTLDYFVNVNSGRLAIGHDKAGRIVIVHVDGHTAERGVSLHELADMLVGWGVINAINLDGGGSVTAVLNHTLVNYPGDICINNEQKETRCAREVSTVICVQEPQCQPPDCSNHGYCVQGQCHCHGNWVGHACHLLECGVTNCTGHGTCTETGCLCEPGWQGEACDHTCPPQKYGLECSATCRCHNAGSCDAVDGSCSCTPGYVGQLCDRECPYGFYGDGCQQLCYCNNSCGCHHVTGECSDVPVYYSALMPAAQCLAEQVMKDMTNSDYNMPWIVSSVAVVTLALCSVGLNVLLLSRLHNVCASPKHPYHSTIVIDSDSETSSDYEQPQRRRPRGRLKYPLNKKVQAVNIMQAGQLSDSEVSQNETPGVVM